METVLFAADDDPWGNDLAQGHFPPFRERVKVILGAGNHHAADLAPNYLGRADQVLGHGRDLSDSCSATGISITDVSYPLLLTKQREESHPTRGSYPRDVALVTDAVETVNVDEVLIPMLELIPMSMK